MTRFLRNTNLALLVLTLSACATIGEDKEEWVVGEDTIESQAGDTSNQVGSTSAVTTNESNGGSSQSSSEDAAEDVTDYVDQYTLPRSAAPIVEGTSAQTSTPIGQNTQAAVSPPSGVNVDSQTGFFPSISIAVTSSHNPAREAGEDDETDTSVSIIPSLAYRGTVNNRHPYQLSVSTSFEDFDEFSELDNEFLSFNAAIKLDVSEKLQADVYGNTETGSDPRGATATRILDATTENDEYDRNTIGARVTLGRRTNPLQLVGGVETTDIDFTNNNQNQRDRDQNTVSGAAHWNVSPRTSVYLRLLQTDIDYDLAVTNNLDSTEFETTIGVGWEPSYTTSLLFEAGNIEKDFDRTRFTDSDVNSYRGRINWNPTADTTLSVYASRRFEEATELNSPFTVSDLLGLNLGHAFTERLRAQAFVNFIDDDLENVRQDETLDYGIGLFYDIARWLTLGANWQRTQRDSTDPDAEYDSDSFTISATLRHTETGRFGQPAVQTSPDATVSE